MTYKTNRKLKRLGDKEFVEDIKHYIKSSHHFYEVRIPELKVLAKRLYEEYNLKEFYKIFNRLWKSGYHEEKALALYTLQLYKEDYDLFTWKFIKSQLNEMKSFDQIDWVAINIVGEILIKYPSVEKEILKYLEGKNIWLKKMAISSTIPLIRGGEFKLALKIAELKIDSKNEHIQKAVGFILNEISKKDKEVAKDFILRHSHMPNITFNIATEELKDLRKIRGIKKLKADKFARFIFWR